MSIYILRQNGRIYNGKIIKGSGWVEGVELHNGRGFIVNSQSKKSRTIRKVGGCPADGLREVDKEANRERAIKRARTTLRRKVKELCGQADRAYMLTLTYAENMADYDRAVRDLRNFFRRVARAVKGKVHYVAVAERQERGAWHWHLVIDVYLDHSVWTELWGNGFVWVKRVRSSRGAAAYIAKYIAKAFQEVAEGRKRYLCSWGLGDWEVSLTSVNDEFETWFGIVDGGGYRLGGVFSIPGDVIWWEAFVEAVKDELSFANYSSCR